MSQHPDNHQLEQDSRIVQEQVLVPETFFGQARRIEAEERIMALISQTRASFGGGDWRANQKVGQAVLLRLCSVGAFDRLEFLLATSM